MHFLLCRLIFELISHTIGHGYSIACDVLSSLFGHHNWVVFEVFGDKLIKVQLRDPYWLVAILVDREYEPEVGVILAQSLRPDTLFLDCGASIGWWSVFASRFISDPRRIWAVEAARDAFTALLDNSDLNHGAYQCIPAAIWREGQQELSIVRARSHASTKVVEQPDAAAAAHLDGVQSVTIDEIIEREVKGDPVRVVVKLDVEGSEIAALEGASRLQTVEVLVIYEDHGEDSASRNTCAFRDAGFAVFYLSPRGEVKMIPDARAAHAIKTDPRIGYNFIACRPGTESFTELGRMAAASTHASYPRA